MLYPDCPQSKPWLSWPFFSRVWWGQKQEEGRVWGRRSLVVVQIPYSRARFTQSKQYWPFTFNGASVESVKPSVSPGLMLNVKKYNCITHTMVSRLWETFIPDRTFTCTVSILVGMGVWNVGLHKIQRAALCNDWIIHPRSWTASTIETSIYIVLALKTEGSGFHGKH